LIGCTDSTLEKRITGAVLGINAEPSQGRAEAQEHQNGQGEPESALRLLQRSGRRKQDGESSVETNLEIRHKNKTQI